MNKITAEQAHKAARNLWNRVKEESDSADDDLNILQYFINQQTSLSPQPPAPAGDVVEALKLLREWVEDEECDTFDHIISVDDKFKARGEPKKPAALKKNPISVKLPQ